MKLDFFLYFSGLKLNLRKSEIAGIGVPKRVQVAVWYALYRLNNDTLKILGSHFSYKKKLKEEKKFFQVHNRYSTSIENMENKKPYTRRENFKTIAISKIVFQSFITAVPKYVVNELEKI